MSRYDYEASRVIAGHDHPFYALIMAAMRQADGLNAEGLRRVFPEVWEELQARHDAPGGVIPGDGYEWRTQALREEADDAPGDPDRMPEPPKAETVDLVAALRRSVEAAQARRARERAEQVMQDRPVPLDGRPAPDFPPAPSHCTPPTVLPYGMEEK